MKQLVLSKVIEDYDEYCQICIAGGAKIMPFADFFKQYEIILEEDEECKDCE